MITHIKFAPEKHWLYRPRVWLAKKLWAWAYKVHPHPPRFHEEISNQYVDAQRNAKEDLAVLGRAMFELVGLNSVPTQRTGRD